MKIIEKELEVPVYKQKIIKTGTEKVKKTLYVADDGAEFESRQKCIKYNQKLYSERLKAIPRLDSRKIEMPCFEGND